MVTGIGPVVVVVVVCVVESAGAGATCARAVEAVIRIQACRESSLRRVGSSPLLRFIIKQSSTHRVHLLAVGVALPTVFRQDWGVSWGQDTCLGR